MVVCTHLLLSGTMRRASFESEEPSKNHTPAGANKLQYAINVIQDSLVYIWRVAQQLWMQISRRATRRNARKCYTHKSNEPLSSGSLHVYPSVNVHPVRLPEEVQCVLPSFPEQLTLLPSEWVANKSSNLCPPFLILPTRDGTYVRASNAASLARSVSTSKSTALRASPVCQRRYYSAPCAEPGDRFLDRACIAHGESEQEKRSNISGVLIRPLSFRELPV